MVLLKFVGKYAFRSVGKTTAAKAKIKKADLGMLKVALMVAALDGKVLEEEYDAFRLLARNGFCYEDEAIENVLKDAMRSAGYMLLVAMRTTDDDELVAEFMAEAKAALPNGFAYMSVTDIRQAIVLWMAMAMSDRRYSRRERICIEALRLHFAELKASRIEMENEYWRSLPKNVRCVVEDYPGSRLKLASKDFVGKVEDIAARLGDTADAKARLSELIEKGE